MLLTLAKCKQDSTCFKVCSDYLKEFYYPQQRLLEVGRKLVRKARLDDVSRDSVESVIDGITRQAVRVVVRSPEYGYPILDPGRADTVVKRVDFPFMDKFINMFLEQKYNILPSTAFTQTDNFFSLDAEKSKHIGNFHHFINVVCCLSRLIQYFSDEKRFGEQYPFLPQDYQTDHRLNESEIAFDDSRSGNMRIFKLMLAGFYHDLGKAIIDQRHSIEGEILFSADQTSISLHKLHGVVEEYKSSFGLFEETEMFERDDLTLISKMLLYHDQFGTLGTGEDGYLRLVKIVDFIKMLSLNRHPGFSQKKEQLKWSTRTLFDLWALNIADIMVSTVRKDDLNKFDLQEAYWCDFDQSVVLIEEFLSSEEGEKRLHDLKIACRLLYSHFHREQKLKIHVSDNKKIIEEAVDNSRFHTTERLRRLISSSLRKPLSDLKTRSKSEQAMRLAGSIEKLLDKSNWVYAIERSLEVLGTAEQFKASFAWIGKMDYSLGFFERIADETLKLIDEELTDCIVFTLDDLELSDKLYARSDNIDIAHQDPSIGKFLADDKNGKEIYDNHVIVSLWRDIADQEALSKADRFPLLINGEEVKIVAVELLEKKTTSWIRERKLGDINDADFLHDLNAQFFIDNYTATIIAIISYLLNREKGIDSPKDFEFLYAKERLNQDKIKKIASMVGPFQTNKSVHYILQNIYIY